MLKHIKSEIKRIVWPNKKKVIKEYGIVVGVSIFLMSLIFGLDLLINYFIMTFI